MIEKSYIVILVGGPNTGKTSFYRKFTHGYGNHPTTKCTPIPTIHGMPSMVLIDTPGIVEYRNKFEYSWQGVFRDVDVILNFGNWSEKEIHGIPLAESPTHMTWSGDHDETMKRLGQYLQE